MKNLLCVLLAGASLATAAPRPHIVLVMLDDLGFSDLGCYGSEIETPHIDRLAAEGLRFSQFYNTAKCHSSRISLLTGLYPFQAGNQRMDRAATLAEVLGPAGYFTAMTGKWHLEDQPTDRGFQRYFGHLSGATDYFRGDGTFRLNGEPWAEFGPDFYTTDANTDWAMRFVDEALEAQQPFFLYIAHNAPHYPLQAPREDVRKYRTRYREGWDQIRRARYTKQVELGLIDPAHALSPRPDYIPAWDTLGREARNGEAFRMAVFAAMVDRVDQNMGRLVQHLKERGVYDDTLILLCSDNGACPFERSKGTNRMPWEAGTHWTYDVGWAHVGNTPFRWYKQNQHEGGISSPLIVRWPAGLKTPPGSVTEQPAHLIDFMPTLAELAGAGYPATVAGRAVTPVQGRSLVPVFENRRRTPHEELYFQFSTNRALRRGDWKLVSMRGGRWELYNLAEDRTELHDLADAQPQRVRDLEARWQQLAEEVNQAPASLRQAVKPGPTAPYFKRARGDLPPIPAVPDP